MYLCDILYFFAFVSQICRNSLGICNAMRHINIQNEVGITDGVPGGTWTESGLIMLCIWTSLFSREEFWHIFNAFKMLFKSFAIT